jgi:2-octaprenyl-6-methoxyphenol hydroxylase
MVNKSASVEVVLKRLGPKIAKDTIEADVLIVGGGLVGATLAIALGGAGLKVCVVDVADPIANLDAEFDGRVSAIAMASHRILEALDLWTALDQTAAPILDIRVSDSDSLFFLHYDHRDTSDKAFGYMVENRNLRKALLQKLKALDTVTLLAPTSIASLNRNAHGVEANLATGQKIRARLSVAADGRGSKTRDQAGIKITNWSYNQSAIVCTVNHKKSHDFVANEHFLPAGPFAILPLKGDKEHPGNCSSIVWTERADLSPSIMALEDDAFKVELQKRFGTFLGPINIVGPKWCYPLSLQYSHKTIENRLALIGDAAHAMHPIAGQGLNMGLRDVAALAEVIMDAHRLGLDIGDEIVLERYQRWRRFDNTLMLVMTDGLNRLFSNNIGPIRLARDIGMALVNKTPPLKKIFMRHAMGLVGNLPRLMRKQPL